MSFEYTITPKDIYGTNSPEIPEGWELTGEFRPWRPGDYFLNSEDAVEPVVVSHGPSGSPRLILRRKKVRKVIFTEIRRNSQPLSGEWYLDIGGGYAQWHLADNRANLYPPTTIYHREEVEE